MLTDIPKEIIGLLAREAAYIKHYMYHNNSCDLIMAKHFRKEINNRYFSTFQIVRFK